MYSQSPSTLKCSLANFLSPTEYVALLAAPHTARQEKKPAAAKKVKTKPVRPPLDVYIQPPVKFSRERVPFLLVDADVTPGTMQYLQRANLSVTDARRVLPEGRTDRQILEFARVHNKLLLTHSWRLIARSNLNPWLNAGIVILPSPEPGKRIPVSPDACGELRYALDQLLLDMPYLARQRYNTIYDYRSGLAERVDRLKTRISRRPEF